MIFIRPVVVRDASLDGDLAAYKRYVPGGKFFDDTRPPMQDLEKQLQRMEEGHLPQGEPVPVVPDPPTPEGRS